VVTSWDAARRTNCFGRAGASSSTSRKPRPSWRRLAVAWPAASAAEKRPAEPMIPRTSSPIPFLLPGRGARPAVARSSCPPSRRLSHENNRRLAKRVQGMLYRTREDARMTWLRFRILASQGFRGEPRVSKPYDATIKDLAAQGPADFVACFDGPTSRSVTLLNVDLSTVTTAADVVFGTDS
jgi:hypothetical protein